MIEISKKQHKIWVLFPIKFSGKFSKHVGKKNTLSKLLEILDKKKIIKSDKYEIRVIKNIPTQSGLGGGSMNAASVFNFINKKQKKKIDKKKILEISKLVGSDVLLGMYNKDHDFTLFHRPNLRRLHGIQKNMEDIFVWRYFRSSSFCN